MIGQSVGSDASRLSCFLFRPRKRLEKRRKRSHTNVSNASVTRTSRVSQTPLQTPIPYFHQWVPHGKKALVAIACKTAHIHFRSRKRVHTRLCSKDRTQGHTRRNRWCFGWGVVSLPSERSARFGNPAWPGGRTANFAAFGAWSWVLPKNAESLRDSDALMRVAVPRRRGPAGLRDPVVRPLMLRFSVSVRKVSAQSPVNATRSSSHLNPSTTRPSSKNRTQRLTRRNVCALDVAILEVSCYTDGHRKPLKKFF